MATRNSANLHVQTDSNAADVNLIPNANKSANEFLNEAVESVNKQVDVDMKSMLDAFDALISLSTIRDKDRFRIAQEKFEAEARADTMVRSAQSLTLLSHALKLSLLLSQEPIGNEELIPTNHEGNNVDKGSNADDKKTTLNEEAIDLIHKTIKAREECAKYLEQICGIDVGQDTQIAK